MVWSQSKAVTAAGESNKSSEEGKSDLSPHYFFAKCKYPCAQGMFWHKNIMLFVPDYQIISSKMVPEKTRLLQMVLHNWKVLIKQILEIIMSFNMCASSAFLYSIILCHSNTSIPYHGHGQAIDAISGTRGHSTFVIKSCCL